MQGDGVLAKWRESVDKLLQEKKYDEAKLLTPMDLEISNNGDKAALKLVKFVQATSNSTLPKDPTEYKIKQQNTFNILNNTPPGTGAIRVEKLTREKKSYL